MTFAQRLAFVFLHKLERRFDLTEARDHEARVRVAERAAQTRAAINLNAQREHRFALRSAPDFPKVSA